MFFSPTKLMRFPRVKADGQGYCHCVSRVVEGHFIFQTSGHGSVEAERFIELMRRLEAFSGVRVLTYVLMSNHFHLLCEVPEPKTLSEAEVPVCRLAYNGDLAAGQLADFRRCSLLTYRFRYARRSRLENQPTDRRRYASYL